jgi:hypothetical protein
MIMRVGQWLNETIRKKSKIRVNFISIFTPQRTPSTFKNQPIRYVPVYGNCRCFLGKTIDNKQTLWQILEFQMSDCLLHKKPRVSEK